MLALDARNSYGSLAIYLYFEILTAYVPMPFMPSVRSGVDGVVSLKPYLLQTRACLLGVFGSRQSLSTLVDFGVECAMLINERRWI